MTKISELTECHACEVDNYVLCNTCKMYYDIHSNSELCNTCYECFDNIDDEDYESDDYESDDYEPDNFNYLLNDTILSDTGENVDYDNSVIAFRYVGLEDYTICLRIDRQKNLNLDEWRSGEKSGEILKELKKIVRELRKLKYINNSTEFLLVAEDLNYNNGLDNLVRYYDRIGFYIDAERNSQDCDNTAMKSTIKTFLSK